MNLDSKVYGDLMNKYYRLGKVQGLTVAASAEEFYGFHYSHVAGLHYHRQGYGSGLYFRLHDGRVIDQAARSHDPDPVYFDATTH